MTTPPQDAQPFLTTRWTRVCLAKEASDAGRRALAELCASYYEPVVAFCAANCATLEKRGR
jgi:RNA polymerase sigma-70 factor (ECF subfamily)